MSWRDEINKRNGSNERNWRNERNDNKYDVMGTDRDGDNKKYKANEDGKITEAVMMLSKIKK